jgi:hypothetical protein
MTSKREELAANYFNCSERERASSRRHQTGDHLPPVLGNAGAAANVDILEKAIEDGVRVQPFVRTSRSHLP